ncbi:metabotropic glutamate receptor 3-like [Ptychodera flava]|uniref:metabotropic glutamate receptor 3-like n=1 Tax=Ptychodera flava TaxID=63121 RepID=UPI00396A7AAA
MATIPLKLTLGIQIDAKISCIILFTLINLCDSRHLPDMTKKTYSKPGDLVLAGMFSIHEFDADRKCTDLREFDTVQKMEAMVFAIDKINQRDDILPNITLGFQIYDDCGFEDTASYIAMSLRDKSCAGAYKNDTHNIVGVVGTEWSSTSIPSNKILNLLHLPQISYYATSDELSDKNRFPYFLRTVPPDRMQVQAIIDLLLHFGWTYISTVNSGESYAQNGIKYLLNEVAKHGICIAVSLEISRFNENLDHTVRTLQKHANAKAVVVFSVPLEANLFLRAVREAGAADDFVWIASDAWGPNLHLYGNLPAAVGGFFIKLYSQEVPEFEEYFKTLYQKTEHRNPWLVEFLDHDVNCTIASDSCVRDSYPPGFSKSSLVSLVIDAVYTFAYGLEAWRNYFCPNATGMCPEMRQINAEDTIEYLKSVNFKGTTGRISFDENGDIKGKYIFKTLKEFNGSYEFVKIGTWDARKDFNRLDLNDSGIQWNFTKSFAEYDDLVPTSVCSQPCQPGHFLIPGSSPCCWECFRCDEDEISYNGSRCQKCPMLMWPNDNFTECKPMSPVYLKWSDGWGVGLATMAALGIIATLTISALYIRYRSRALIKASSRELSFMMLVGVLLSFPMVFIYIGKPTDATCVVCRLGYTFSFTLLYAPLLTKVNRIYRIFDSGKKSTKRPRLISPTSQVVIAGALIIVQVIISLTFVIYVPPAATYLPSATHKARAELFCNIQTTEIIASFSYNTILIIFCCFYAFKTRHLPDNYNESRFIAFCVYTTLVITIAFIPTYFAINVSSVRVIILSLATMLNATIILVFLYAPKIYALHFVMNIKVDSAPS